MFSAGAAALGVDPARSIAVEDATSGAASAAAAGFGDVVGVDRGTGADALRAAGATVVVSDLDVFVDAAADEGARSDSDSADQDTRSDNEDPA
jgi:beta-phosphoglucomutase-like phosphatase (HAD superfamily)